MFAVIYRTYIKPGKEAAYVRYWKQIASYFVQERGALGSTLHKAEGGLWVAYSRWPDRATRDASWPKVGESASLELPPSIREAIEDLKGCMRTDNPLPEICMEVAEEVKVDSVYGLF